MKSKKIIAAVLGVVGLMSVSMSASAKEVCVGAVEHGYIGGSLFAVDSSTPNANEMFMLRRGFQTIAASERGDNYVWIRVKGRTDSTGSEAYNLALSKRRAEAVAGELLAAGAKREMFHLVSYGESKPVYSNKTAEGRYKNRSAIVDMYAVDKEKTHWCYQNYPRAVEPWVD